MVPLAAALAMGFALGPALAGSTATLAAPVEKETQVIKDGKIWRCEGDRCATDAEYETVNRLVRACRAIVDEAGPVTDVTSGDDRLGPDELAACNR